ncbi:hypothetical protein GJ744_003115 [Endocarpon pusillum]|uniref:Heterokaryon incompatibility domain-containing protein n=1 Tax=Endocarpon pusillum TaxID=364733 RepID=A0A8H7ARZ3_9EURO|nr:hypothetical protein GJ744_003115 [Endocarpon pusillum]
MRLLQADENGEFSLTDDLINNIPPYAILSHTWGEDHEEVSFIDLTRGPRRTKAGYKKLRFLHSRLHATAYDTFGWIHAASTKRTTLSFQKPSLRCIVGTAERRNAMHTFQTFRLWTITRSVHRYSHGSPPFATAKPSELLARCMERRYDRRMWRRLTDRVPFPICVL